MTDAELVEAWREGRESALVSLMNRYRDPLYGFLRSWTGDRAEAEDLFQETWVRLLKQLPRYEERQQFRALMYTVAGRLATDHSRKLKRRGHHDRIAGEEGAGLKSMDPCPLESLEAKDRRLLLDQAIAALPEPQRELVLLRMEAGLSFQEIADLKQEKIGTLLPRMHRAVKRMRGYFRGMGYEIR